jgi:nucleoside-diphosphate-sugar epimerase
MNKKKVFVTGSNGFIGSHVCKLLQAHYTVLKGVRAEHLLQTNDPETIRLNVNSNTDWLAALQNVDTVIHCAAIAHNNSNDPNYIHEVNVEGTVNLALQAFNNGVKRIIFISSIGVLGNQTTNNRVFNEGSPILAQFEYTQSKAKAKAEVELLKIAKDTGLEVVIIRPVLVYGANAPGNFGKLVNIVKKLSILPFGSCKNKRSFISVDNLVDFISVCIEHPKAKNEVFCISDGQDISIKEFTDAIAKGLDKKLLQIAIPNFIFYFLGKITGKADQVVQLTGDLQVDSSKATELIGWKPPFTMGETLQNLSKSH